MFVFVCVFVCVCVCVYGGRGGGEGRISEKYSRKKMKPKGVTSQMKAIDEYFLMVLLTLLPNRVHVFFANFRFNLNREIR